MIQTENQRTSVLFGESEAMPTYKDVGEIRKENLNRVLSEYGDTINSFGEKYGLKPAVLVQIRNDTSGKYRMGTKYAREFEQKLGLPYGWLDHEHIPGISETAIELARIYDRLPEVKKEIVKSFMYSLPKEKPKNGNPQMTVIKDIKDGNE